MRGPGPPGPMRGGRTGPDGGREIGRIGGRCESKMARRKKLSLVVYSSDATHGSFYGERLADEGFGVTLVQTPEEAEKAAAADGAVALVDVTSGPEGMKMVRSLRRGHPKVAIVATGGEATDELIVQARRAGADLYYPLSTSAPAALGDAVRATYAARTAEEERDDAVRQLKSVRDQLESVGFVDAVTGAFDSTFLSMRLKEEMARATRYGRSLAILMVDVDRFSEFVERNGDRLGSFLLRQAFAVFRWSTRPSDCICRIEDDKFVIILPETNLHGAIRAAEKIRLGVEDFRFAQSEGSGCVAITVSIGAATLEESMTSPEDVLRAAEAALYEAKVRGKNMVRW